MENKKGEVYPEGKFSPNIPSGKQEAQSSKRGDLVCQRCKVSRVTKWADVDKSSNKTLLWEMVAAGNAQQPRR